MSQHLVFLIHGMGEHKKDWSLDAQSTLKRAYEQYPNLASMPFDDAYMFHEITYDHLFEDIRDAWQGEADAVKERLVAMGVGSGLIHTLTRLAQSGTGDGFFRTHVLDVIFYRFFPTVRDPVRIHVAKAITEKLNDVRRNSTHAIKWSVIAHSLGTAVAHDTLHYMFAEPSHTNSMPDIEPLSVRNFSPHVYMACANVSRILSKGNEIPVYNSRCRPALTPSRDAIMRYFLNAWNMFDPFTRPSRFEPSHTWLDARTQAARHARFQDIKTTEVRQKNVHALEHYLENPAVHVPFFRATNDFMGIVSQSEASQALQDYRQSVLQAHLGSHTEELRALIETHGGELEDLLSMAHTFQTMQEALR
ncbi:hypothetical protein [Pseudohongiella sp.]|uniref:DDHD domain-containing protein n=1 Tax=marine sediment metagenome TaxID=412755 RepID=A0A0F9YHX5_9ZZZZ|nr:hypothetical protein [Pseudohongiella sp.]HDZ08435.1 hypothetical protein [Pseudohongiella sp.]